MRCHSNRLKEATLAVAFSCFGCKRVVNETLFDSMAELYFIDCGSKGKFKFKYDRWQIMNQTPELLFERLWKDFEIYFGDYSL